MPLLRRLSDLLAEADFLEVQLRVLQETGPSHRKLNLQVVIAGVHGRLDALERRLRLRATELGEDDRAAIIELRRGLTVLAIGGTSYRGPERRTAKIPKD